MANKSTNIPKTNNNLSVQFMPIVYSRWISRSWLETGTNM